MTATLRPIGHLKGAAGGREQLTVPSGISVRQALALVDIPSEVVALVVINGVHQADKDILLNDGDDVKLMAIIGGG